MPNSWLGLILSFVLVFVIIGLSELFQRLKIYGPEGSRKFIHIGVSNWWFLMFYYFDNLWIALIAPFIFILLNYYSYKTNLIKSMEREGKGNLGTVYFPIALFILVIFSFIVNNPFYGGVGILVLGYGDGLAGLIGSKFGKTKVYHDKTLAGLLTMFIASFVVILLLFMIYTPITGVVVYLFSFVIAITASLVELFTKKGLDNLTVPFVVTLLTYLLVGLI